MDSELTEPEWLQSGVEPILARVRPFLNVTLQVIREPAAFAKSFMGGEAIPLNPIQLVATAAAIVGLAESLAHDLVGIPFRLGAWEYAYRGIAPYLYYAELGALMHFGLWITGVRGRKVTTAIAFVLFSGGTLATLATVLLLGWMVAVRRLVGPQLSAISAQPFALQFLLIFLVSLIFVFAFRFISAFGKMARAGYSVARWRMMVAMFFTLISSSVVAHLIPLPTLQVVLDKGGAHIRYPSFQDFFDDVSWIDQQGEFARPKSK